METRGIRLAARVLASIGARGPVKPQTLAVCIGMRLEVYAGERLTIAADTTPAVDGCVCAGPHIDPTSQRESTADTLIAVACARHLARRAGLDEHDLDVINTLTTELCAVDLTQLPRTAAPARAVA